MLTTTNQTYNLMIKNLLNCLANENKKYNQGLSFVQQFQFRYDFFFIRRIPLQSMTHDET